MPKNQTKFTIAHKIKYPFLESVAKDPSGVYCKWCHQQFSIANGGSARIEQHIQAKQHILAAERVKTQISLPELLKNPKEDLKLCTAAKELGFTYHVAKHGISYNSTNCSSQLFQIMFEKDYQCKSTKTSAIVRKVIGPIIDKEVEENLSEMSFVTLMTDASNRQDQKLLPVLVRGYLPQKGVVIYKLDLYLIDDERSLTLTNSLIKTAEKWKIVDKIVGFSADNCNTNFGGRERNGENNVFAHLKKHLKRELFGLGCLFHIVGNSVSNSTAVLPFDIASITQATFQHFHIRSVQRAVLQSICEEASITYKKLTKQSNVRFLTLLSAIQTIGKMFEPLKEYFLYKCDDPPTLLTQFFGADYSLFWILFLEGHLELTNSYILKMEAKEPASFEVAAFVVELLEKLQMRSDNEYMAAKSKTEYNKLPSDRQYRIKRFISKFYQSQIKYLKDWLRSADGTENFAWCSLKNPLDWNEMSKSLDFVYEKIGGHVFNKVNRDKIIDDVTMVNNFITQSIHSWTQNELSAVNRWKKVFEFSNQNSLETNNLKLFVELVMSLPGTNAQSERYFSMAFGTWSDEKGQMNKETLDALLSIKFNWQLECDQFYEKFKDDKVILRKVISSEKYG
jgi:hypothetical protein